jgi:large subunit ribosomal protein L25
MSRQVLKVEINEKRGTSNARKNRRNGFIPATVCSKGQTTNILVKERDFIKLLQSGVRSSTLIDLEIPSVNDPATVFLKSVQRHPVNQNFLSLDFFKVTFGEKIQVEIEIKFIGEPVGVKMGGLVEYLLNKVKVETLPRNIPESITVDISNMEIGDSIIIKDIAIPENVKVLVDEKIIVIICHAPKKIVEEEIVEAVEGEEEAVAAEGEAAAEEKAEKDDKEDKKGDRKGDKK